MKQYSALIENFKPNFAKYSQQIFELGQLQIIRKTFLRHINFITKMESPLYYSTIENLNYGLFTNLEKLKLIAKEIKEEEVTAET